MLISQDIGHQSRRFSEFTSEHLIFTLSEKNEYRSTQSQRNKEQTDIHWIPKACDWSLGTGLLES